MAKNPFFEQSAANPFLEAEPEKEGAFARAGRIARDKDGGLLAAAGSLIEAALPDSRAGRDTTVAALKSAVGVPQGAIGLIDIASGGRFGRALEQAGIDPNAAQRALDELYSPETQAAKREVQAAEGFTDTAGAMLRNPSTILTGIGESIAPMFAGGLVGRGAVALAPRLSPAAGAAIGEGALMAGQSASQIRGQTEDGLLTPTQSALAAGTGVVGGLVGRAGGALSNRVGIGDVDTAIVQGGLAEAAKRPGFLARTALGAGIEGGVEEMPQSVVEQAAQNVALGKPWDEGLGSAAAQGLVVGASFGAVGANLSRPTAPQAPAPAADPLDAQTARMTAATDAYLNDRPGADTIASIVSKPTVDEAIDALGAESPSMEQILADKRQRAAQRVAQELGFADQVDARSPEQIMADAAARREQATLAAQQELGLSPSATAAQDVRTADQIVADFEARRQAAIEQVQGAPAAQEGRTEQDFAERRRQAALAAISDMGESLPRFRYTPALQGNKQEVTSTEPDLVGTYVQQMRETNTPAARAFVQLYESGRITDQDVSDTIARQNPQLQAPAEPAIPSNATPLQAEGIQIEQMRRRASPTLDLKQPEQAVGERAQAQRAEGDATPELTQQRLEAAAAQGRQQDPMTPVQVGQYIDALRLENTPQARALVQEYEAGRVTDQDVADAVNAQRRYQLGGVDLAQNRIETAATQGAQQAPGLQVERSGARAPNAALAEAVQMYGDMPLTARDMTVEGASERLSRAAAQARQTPESLIQVGDTTQTSRVPFRGRNEAIRTSNEGLDAAAAGRGGERMTAPRPTLIGGKPPGSYTDQQLKDLVGNDLVPAITRRGAETELAVRALQQRAQAPAAPAAPGTTSPGGIILASAKRSPQDVLSSVARSRESKVGRPVQMTVVDTNTLPAQRGTGAGALSRQAHTIINNVSRVFGKKLVVFESDDATAPDGFYSRDDADTIYLNRNSETPHLVVFGHELLHSLRKDNEAGYQALVKTIKLKEGADISETPGIRGDIEEFTADLMGNQFRDNEFWVATFRDIIASKGEQQGRQVVTRLAAAAVRAVNGLMKALGRAPGYNTDEMVANLGEVKTALRSALSTYAKDRYGAAVAMERERVAAAPAPAPAAAAAPATTVAPTATEDAQASEKRVEGPFKPARTMSELEGVRYSLRRADFVSPEDRQEVSTTRPVPAPKKGRTSNAYDEKWVIDGKDVRASKKHVDAVMRALREYNTLSGKGNAPKLMQELHDVVVENLLWLHDLVPENVRARAKLWYDGANRIANDWTSKYGVSLRQSSGVLAVLSPQMDWFKNVSLGERVISIWKNRQNEAWSPAMTDWLQSWVNASKDVDTKASRQAILDEARPLQGMTLAQMNSRQAALYVRAFDETYYERQYRLVTPEGGFGEYVTNSDDGDASVTWGGFDTIEKAISILNDGSFRNVEEKLGDEHKVRNFYNNIINPGSADGHVTIDTHAVAAALVKALSGSSREVTDNFGAAGQNAETGASGTYGLFADAYRDAAVKRGILPREMQSVTWEAVRALFPASIKDQLAPQVDAVWDRFRKGEITRDQAREEVRTLSGGIRKMAWEGSDAGAFAADGGSSFNAEIAENPADRTARTLPPEVAKDKLQVNLSANTSSVPGIAALQAAAAGGDMLAHRLIQDIALDNLRHLLSGTSARVKADGVTGLYGGYVESGLSMTVTFADDDRATVLAALAKFADNFNQEQVHVRRGVKAKPGTAFDDGSYATPVYRWELKKPLSRKQIENVISGSGLYGLTFGDNFVEAYYVGDPSNEAARQQFDQSIDQAGQLLGRAAESVGRSVERLWAYGDSERGLGFERIQGDVPSGAGVSSQTANRVAGYLNAVKDKDGRPALGRVKTFEQAEITPEQDALQTRIAEIYQSLPDNDLKNPNVRKAYSELAREVLRQFKALPVKVEVLAGQGEPYKSSADMRRDVLDNNHLFIFGTTPETFGPPGEDFTGHPLLENSGLSDQNGQPLLYNDLLRAVHDYYAHTMSPTQFGPKGEEAAWKNHMSMTNNMWARWALTIETRGQNSWVNFRPDLERSTPISEREFARQKAALLPVEYSLTGNRAVDKPMKEFIGRLGDRVRQGSKPVKPSVKASDKRQVNTPEFRRWFGDSKVVDENGEPLVGYTGTSKDVDFTKFKVPKNGVWFTTDPQEASMYAMDNDSKDLKYNPDTRRYDEVNTASRVMPTFLRIENPATLSEADSQAMRFASNYRKAQGLIFDRLRAQGYDGVDMGDGVWVVIGQPAQIKSAIGNRGTFDPANADIRASEKRNIFNQRIQPAWSVAPDTKLDAFLYKLQDKQIDLKRITQAIKDAIGGLAEKWDAYLAEELYHGRTAKQTKDFLQDEMKPLVDAMTANRVTMPELEEYLHNRHAEERNRQIATINPNLPDAGSGIATADARRYLAGLPANQRQRYEALARQVDAINKKTRQLLVSSGLEKQDTIDAWERTYPTYMPLFREDADYDGSQSPGGTGMGFSVRGPSSKRATGSADREVVDILANVALMRERTLTRAEKARVGRALYGLAVQNPNPGFWLAIDPKTPKDIPGAVNTLISMGMTAQDARGLMQQPTVPYVDPRTGLVTYRVNPLLRNADHVMSVRVDGEDKMLVFNPRDERAQRMVTSLKNLDAQQLGGALSAAAFVSRWFAQVNTQYNPVFGAINLIRDVGGAAFNLTTTDIADRKAQVMAGVGPALVGIYQDLRKNRTGQRSQGQWAQLWEEFQREGGQTGFRDMFSRSDERAVALQRMLDPSSWAESPLGKFFTANGTLKAPMEVVRKGAAPVFNWLSDYNETLENAVRLSAYKAAKDKGLSNAKAASIAKNLTVNFNRKGQVGVQMGALYAFFNASVQGTARLAETLGSGRDPNASAYSPNRYMGKTGQRIIAGGLLLGVMQAVALAMAGFDEDEPPEFIKERNLVIPLDWVDNLGGPDLDGKYLTIPMPLGLNVIPNTGRVLAEWWMSGFKDTPKRVASITGSFLEMFNPIGNAGWSVQTIAPTFADPLVALSENRDWTGKPIAKEDRSGTDPTPGYTRAKDTASIISKGIAYALNAVSGGTDYKPGVVSPTPDQIDYLIGQVTGGVGREVLKVSQAVESGVTGEDLPTYKIPVAGRFYGDTKELSAVSSRYYDNLTRMNQHENEIKGRAADRVPIGDYFEDNPEARLVSLSNRIEREVSDLRRRKRELIKREASKESIKMVEEAIRRRMQSLNDAIERAQKRTPNNGLNP